MKMTKEDIIRKLTSRKLWMAVAEFVTGCILAFGGAESTAQEVGGLILMGAAVLAYIIGEGLTDAARERADVYLNVEETGNE